jgi:malonyl-CoA O-methyltransferase
MSEAKQRLSKKEIARSFNHAADTYEDAAVLQREVADRLLSRLDFININPKLVLDLGGGTGYSALLLEKRYKHAKIVILDLAEKMLLKGKINHKRWFDHKRYVCADAEKIPFADNTADLIFSNLMLHWTQDPEATIKEMQRVLKPEGLLLFSTLGPDTLFELKKSWEIVDSKPHVHQFLDMHFIGDYLQRAAFKSPVVDMEFITLTYNDLKKVLVDLKDLGTHNIANNRNRALTGKEKFSKFVRAYEEFRNQDGLLPVTYEVIYGLGWGTEKNLQSEISIPLESIQR